MINAEDSSTPTTLQKAMGEPLRSEQRINQYLPRVLSLFDMIALFILIILFVPNISVVQIIQATGPYIYLYWLLAFAVFLVPSAIVTTQLNRFIHADGSIYVWTHRALGAIWGFFAAFCSWFPGVLTILTAGASVVSILQYLGPLLYGPHTTWLTAPWQQGLVILGIIALSGVLSLLPLPALMKIAKGTVALHLLAFVLIGLSGLLWLVRGQSPQVIYTPHPATTSVFGSIGIFGFIIITLLGLEVPFNVAAETKKRATSRRALRWGALIVCAGYLIGTFGVTTILPLNTSMFNYNFLAAIAPVLGAPVAVLAAIIFSAFFIVAAAMYNITFARILFTSALDQRLPASLTRISRWSVPAYAINFQTLLMLVLAILIYIVIPLFLPESGPHFLLMSLDVIIASGSILWFLSMIFLFLDLPLLIRSRRSLPRRAQGNLLLPVWALHLCSFIGLLSTLIGIVVIVLVPFDQFFTSGTWTLAIGSTLFIVLFLGLLGSAYPRLLSSVQQQTAIARENARLYEELRVTYEKLYQLDQLKDAFLSTASHELRTPLTIVQGYVELLGEMDDEYLDAATRSAFINNARRACDELALLLANIMDASTLHLDTVTLRCTNISMHQLCSSVIDLFEPIIVQQERRIELAIPETVLVHADETRLKQVIRNLIANALRYSPPHTPVLITTTVDKEHSLVYTSITDHGAGIPQEKQKVIFERFVRLDRDTHGDIRGSGLGLAICQQLIEAMNGTIIVKSSGIPGEGSTFTFSLPLVVGPEW